MTAYLIKGTLDAYVFATDTLPFFKKRENKVKGFQLSQIYERLFGRSPNEAHSAEADCLNLMECCIATNDEFVAVADRAKIKFNDIPPRK